MHIQVCTKWVQWVKKKKVTNYNYVGRQSSSGVKTEIGGEGIRNGSDQNT